MAKKTGEAFNINRLFQGFRNGDKTAEKELLGHLTVSFRIFAKQRIRDEYDSEDVVQETLVTIMEKSRDIEIETSFAAWAYKILQNKIMNYVSSKQNRKRLSENPGAEFKNTGTPHRDVELSLRLRECFRKINKQNPHHARILNLKYQGFSVQEICRIMKITPNNMYVKLFRARAALEQCLKEGDSDNE